MKTRSPFILIPLLGYAGLWVLGSAFSLLYFSVFHVSMDVEHSVAMIQKLPASLAIATVPLCSFASFFVTARIVLKKYPAPFDARDVLKAGLISLVVTVVLDLLITVGIERIDILVFPVNLMYLFAWLTIVPSVLLAGRRKSKPATNP
jgi:hypothetical protein